MLRKKSTRGLSLLLIPIVLKKKKKKQQQRHLIASNANIKQVM